MLQEIQQFALPCIPNQGYLKIPHTKVPCPFTRQSATPMGNPMSVLAGGQFVSVFDSHCSTVADLPSALPNRALNVHLQRNSSIAPHLPTHSTTPQTTAPVEDLPSALPLCAAQRTACRDTKGTAYRGARRTAYRDAKGTHSCSDWHALAGCHLLEACPMIRHTVAHH
eukprot:1159134-Pelagomonas_calceolata.AAC.17